MKKYNYQNNLVSKKELKDILSWCFSKYDFMQSANLADELKTLGFKFAGRAGISISIEDLKVPSYKNSLLKRINQDILNYEKVYLQGIITNVERYQKIIDTWDLTSESLKNQIIEYFKNYDPLNSVYIMASSGARGNFSQVRQLIGMRGLMSSPSGQILNLAIKKNFREGLSVTDYLMSGYGARKGIVDTALKTANSGYLTRRLIDVAQDIIIREKDCFTKQSFFIPIKNSRTLDWEKSLKKIVGLNLNKPILKKNSTCLISTINSPISENLIRILKQNSITKLYIRSPLTCKLYRSICQNCYGWDLANENLVDMGEAIGILAGQSIGEPGTQLTMRTFHTGGVFQSRTREQIFSPTTGVVKFSNFLKLSPLRTNRGEEVVVSKNSGYIIIIPVLKSKSFVQFEVKQDTILFLKDKQYIKKGRIIGEFIDKNRQFKPDIKPVICSNSGELVVPLIQTRINKVDQNRLFWLLEGQVYNSPPNSFINFYPDCHLNKSGFIHRTKIISHYSGSIQKANFENNFLNRKIFLENNFGYLKNSKLQKFKDNHTVLSSRKTSYLISTNFFYQNTFLPSQKINYSIPANFFYKTAFLKKTHMQDLGKLLRNSYLTLTGGLLFYRSFFFLHNNDYKDIIYYKPLSLRERFNLKQIDGETVGRKTASNIFEQIIKPKQEILEIRMNPFKWLQSVRIKHRTLIWLEEETEKLNCNTLILRIKNKTFITRKQLIKPDYCSKGSGLLILTPIMDNIIKTFIIKYGLFYKTEFFKYSKNIKKLIYVGESFFKNKLILYEKKISMDRNKRISQILIRPIKCYEFSRVTQSEQVFKTGNNSFKILNFFSKSKITFNNKQLIKTKKSINLVSETLKYKFNIANFKSRSFNLFENRLNHRVNVIKFTKFCASQYIPTNLNYKNLKSCLLTQKKQFIDKYTIFIFLESITSTMKEVVKFKIISQESKQVLLISNSNCTIVKINSKYPKKLNDFIINSAKISEVGKIIMKNKNFLTIQKGQPYFFPNCRAQVSGNLNSLSYHLVPPSSKINKKIESKRLVYLQKKDFLKVATEGCFKGRTSGGINSASIGSKFATFHFSKLFIKNRGTLHSCLVPRFITKFVIKEPTSLTNLLTYSTDRDFKKKLKKKFPKDIKKKLRKIVPRNICLKNSDIKNNKLKSKNSFQLIFLKFIEYPFVKSAKSVRFYSVSEDYFSKEYNSVFCKNKQFLEDDTVVGFLKIEKEISGDIIQGLPRIEEILEARKRQTLSKKTPISQRVGSIIQKTNLNFEFKFYKMGITLKDNEKANVYKLLKVYFNYYGNLQSFKQKKSVINARLTSNFEGSYKSFKKVQMFILESVQSIYQSQGIAINDKHLEVIIQQMTTRVLITDGGTTPFLPNEITDLYHMKRVNKTGKTRKAYYVPVLFGITKAALNSPSFLSAASFQETVRVLTKAGIEGKIDWLRGLKESIIIGKLIPSGTGFRNLTMPTKPIDPIAMKPTVSISNARLKSDDLKL